MIKETNYNSLKEKLGSKKYFSSPKEEIEEKSNYRTIKKRLKGSEEKGAERPFEKAYAILTYLTGSGFVGKIPENLKQGSKEYNNFFKEKVKNYSKKDIEEGIIYRLNQLEREGLQHSRFLRKDKEGKYKVERDIERTWEGHVAPYEISLSLISDLDKMLSSKRFLKKHGIPTDEIKKYKNTLKKRVGRILNIGVENATSPEKAESARELLKYAKREGLINYQRSGLEKSVVVLFIGSILASLFFLSPNLTGNVIGNLETSSSNIIALVLFVLGIAGFAFFKKR